MLMTYLMSYVLYLIHLMYFSLMLGRVMLTCDSFALVGWTSTPKGGLLLGARMVASGSPVPEGAVSHPSGLEFGIGWDDRRLAVGAVDHPLRPVTLNFQYTQPIGWLPPPLLACRHDCQVLSLSGRCNPCTPSSFSIDSAGSTGFPFSKICESTRNGGLYASL